tara:strand:+ start:1303 stop:1527 length:225 start_codon:yes stop_codon:yes gene_type:complete
MVSEILFGMDESTLAYDLQRAHSADIWFLRARFWFWGGVASLSSFVLGQAFAIMGVNTLSIAWNGLVDFWHHLW